MTNEHRIFGPPGTGKTTTLARNVALAAERFGEDKVMVCSFTKAAATEAAGRDLPILPTMIGTLHSICHRALDRPIIAETQIAEFNEQYPSQALSGRGGGLDDAGLTVPEGQAPGDPYLRAYQLFRARMITRDSWKTSVGGFARAWEDWKDEHDYCDFTDLIEFCLERKPSPPGYPQVLFVDEAQDLNRLQVSLIRKWGLNMDHIVLIGDDDQCIYDWAGADASNMLLPVIPDTHKIILKQSYRVPRAVHARAQAWIGECRNRQAKDYLPDDREGLVVELPHGNWRAPRDLVTEVAKYTETGSSVMLIASCSYMLTPLVRELREEGVPFHNPYRRTRGDWNPLSRQAGSTGTRLRQFMSLDDTGLGFEWTAASLHSWTGLIKSTGIIKRGARKVMEEAAEADPGRRLTADDLLAYFEPRFFEETMVPSPEWLMRYVRPDKQQALKFALDIYRRKGEAAFNRPQVIVGTIHSIKGGESDVVFLIPDLSREAMREWSGFGSPGHDAIRRLFYVGMTRARETLVLVSPGIPSLSVRF